MGVGTPDDIVESVRRGIDMFDCVMPTRAGRHGLAYTRFGKVNLRNAGHAEDPGRSIRVTARRRGIIPRLSASPREVRRDPRHDAADLGQPRLLPGADGGPACSAISDGRLDDFIAASKEGWAKGEGADQG